MAGKKGQPTATDILDNIGIDAICDRIEDDKSYKAIAEELGINKATLIIWIHADDNRSARAKASRELAGRFNDDAALQVLKNLPADATSAQIAQARELAQHYRWRAKARNPREYGDKQTIAGDPDNPLQVNHKVTRVELVALDDSTD